MLNIVYKTYFDLASCYQLFIIYLDQNMVLVYLLCFHLTCN